MFKIKSLRTQTDHNNGQCLAMKCVYEMKFSLYFCYVLTSHYLLQNIAQRCELLQKSYETDVLVIILITAYTKRARVCH